MKKVLFIGVTCYNFRKSFPSHLESKFLGLSRGMEVFTLARGKPFHKTIWNSEFYLLPANIFFWPLALFLSFYLCLAKKIDTIVCQSPLLEGLVGIILKKILKKELIIDVHGDWLEGPFLSKKRKFESFKKKVVPILAKLSLNNADKIRVISQWALKQTKEIAPDKPHFLFPAFTDLNLFLKEQNTKFENFILFVGQLEKIKGVEYLIEAFAGIKKEFPEFKLVIIGDGSERKSLERRTSDLELRDGVEFKGRLSLEAAKNIMKNCYCLVLPSLSEGLGRVLMEAMALSKPLIGSNVGGIPDLIKDGRNGFLVEKANPQDLAEKLGILLKNRKLVLDMGERGREFIKSNFSNEKYCQNFINLINS